MDLRWAKNIINKLFKKEKLVSVILITHNECKKWASFMHKIKEYVEYDYPNKELIIVDNGSKDETVKRIFQMFGGKRNKNGYLQKDIRIFRRVHRPLNKAIEFGIAAAEGNTFFLMKRRNRGNKQRKKRI